RERTRLVSDGSPGAHSPKTRCSGESSLRNARGSALALPPAHATSVGSAPHRIVAVGDLPYVLPVVLDALTDLGGALPREGARVGDRAARAHIVAHDVLSLRISLHVVEVDLLHAELA